MQKNILPPAPLYRPLTTHFWKIYWSFLYIY